MGVLLIASQFYPPGLAREEQSPLLIPVLLSATMALKLLLLKAVMTGTPIPLTDAPTPPAKFPMDGIVLLRIKPALLPVAMV